MMETMQTPMTRAEFEHNLHLLREQIYRGRYHGATPGVEKVRFLPNGRIDLLSINELARLEANMMMQFQNRDFKEMLKNRGDKGELAGSGPEDTEEAQ